MWIEKKINKKTKQIKYFFREKYVDNLTEKEKTISITFDKNTRETRTMVQKILLKKIFESQNNPKKRLIPITFKKLVDECESIFTRQMRNNSKDNMLVQHRVLVAER